MSRKQTCDVCFEEAGDRLTDKMKPICDLCYEDVQRYDDREYSCTIKQSDEPGNLEKCPDYDQTLKKILDNVRKSLKEVSDFKEDLEIHYLLYPELEDKAIYKEIEIAKENLVSEEDTILRTQEIQKVACSTKSASRLRQVEQFLECYVPPPSSPRLPLPKGEQQSEVNTYTLRNRIIYGTTFNGKVVFSEVARLKQINKRGGQISSEIIFRSPRRNEIANVTENAIWTYNYRNTLYRVYNKRLELITEFHGPLLRNFEYVPPTKKKPALFIYHDYSMISANVLENGYLKEVWNHRLSVVKKKVFSSSVLVLTPAMLIIIDVDTGEILWRRNFKIQDKEIYREDINLSDGRVHTMKIDDNNDVVYTVYGILGGKTIEKIPKERFTEILPLPHPIGEIFPRITINPDTGKTYLFLV
jgi:hypothetical protein